MAINKVKFGNDTLIDLTNDSVVPDLLMKGATAHGADGVRITGSFTLDEELTNQDDIINQIQQALLDKAAGTNTSDATASAEDIMLGKTAYVKGNKIEGSFTIDTELDQQDNIINDILTLLNSKFPTNNN